MLLSGFAKCFVITPAPASTLLRVLAERVSDMAPTMQPQVRLPLHDARPPQTM